MRFRIILGAVSAVVLAVGCSDVAGPGTSVQASLVVTPLPSAVNVSRGDSIHVVFAMAVDSASCAQRFLMHRGDSAGPVVSGHMHFAGTYSLMTFVPDSMLLAHQAYFVQMRDSMMTYGGASGGMGGGMGMGGGGRMMLMTPPVGGVRMHDGAGWSFTTGS